MRTAPIQSRASAGFVASLLALGGAVGPAAPIGGQATPVQLGAITPRDGLSSGIVTAVHRDSRGFLWIGTPNGLDRHDGRTVRVSEFHGNVPGTLPNNHVRAIVEDSGGRLWIGTAGGGLSWLDRGSGRFERLETGADGTEPASGDWVETVALDARGRLWIGSLGGGLERFDPANGSRRVYAADPGDPGALSHPMVNVVTVDPNGAVWVGTDRGLNLWTPDTDRFRRWLAVPDDPTALRSGRVLAVARDSTGGLWIGTEEGLHRFEPSDSSFVRIPHDGRPGGLSHPHVTALAPGAPGRLWVGTYGGGLDELDTGRERVVAVHRAGDRRGGLEDDRVRRMTAEPDGTLWLGTWGGGVTRVRPLPVRFTLMDHDPDDPSSLGPGEAASLASDGAHLWVAVYSSGVYRSRADGSGYDHFRHDPADPGTISGDDTDRVLVSESGAIWVGTWQNGLNRLNPVTGRTDRYPNQPARPGSLSGNRVTALEEDASGTLWVGTNNGLNRLDDATPPGRFSLVRALDGVYVETILEDAAGVLWIGSAGSGLFRVDRTSMTARRFTSDPNRVGALRHDHVTTLHEDAGGDLWIGTLGGGLCRLTEDPGSASPARFVHYGEAEGLIDDNVATILSDERDRLWISTRKGLSVMDRETGRFTGFDVGNGLPVEEFSVGAGTLFRDHLVFGSSEGVLVVPPGAEFTEPAPSPLVITSARALEADVPLLASAAGVAPSLPLGEVVAVEFALLDFDLRTEERYAYRLEGLSHDWVDVGPAREIVFTNLDPGSYVLHVRARARSGPWAHAPEPLRFTIEPPLWMTAGFRVLAALVLLGLLLAVVRLRVRTIRDRQAAVEEKERQYAALMENSHDLVTLLDPQHRILFQGPSVQRILGHEPEARVGATPLDIAHPGDRPALRRWLEELARVPNKPGTTVARLGTRNGRWLTLEIRGTAFVTPEGEWRTILNAHDISERLQAEERSRELENVLHQRQKLEAIGTLAGGVAHDFNNLLTVIGGHADLLELEAGDREATLESAAAIRRAKESGASLIRQLLAFARRQVVAPSVLDLNGVVAELERMLRRLVHAHVALELDLEADPAFVEVDRGQLEQVLLNLVVNAGDALSEHGRIVISTSNVDTGEDPEHPEVGPGRWVVLHVSDTGTGIDPGAIPHIFEPFYTTKERGQGTGLGLSTVYGIVTQNGGHVTVETAEGQGTTFRVFLPLAATPPASRGFAGDGETPAAAARRATILVVDDDAEIRRLVTRVLSRQGHRVMEAADGVEAAEALTGLDSPPDLLLTDIVMPGMGGDELARKARIRWPDLPVVFMSGYADGRVAGTNASVLDGVLPKPFSPSALLERIRLELHGAGQPAPRNAGTEPASEG